jgi:hypothetical protein
VSDAGNEHPFCWQWPLRQHGRPIDGQLHVSLAGTLAMSPAMSARNWASASLLIDCDVQKEQLVAGHAFTSPTITQSLSVEHVWS